MSIEVFLQDVEAIAVVIGVGFRMPVPACRGMRSRGKQSGKAWIVLLALLLVAAAILWASTAALEAHRNRITIRSAFMQIPTQIGSNWLNVSYLLTITDPKSGTTEGLADTPVFVKWTYRPEDVIEMRGGEPVSAEGTSWRRMQFRTNYEGRLYFEVRAKDDDDGIQLMTEFVYDGNKLDETIGPIPVVKDGQSL